jgi:hypothetical protein
MKKQILIPLVLMILLLIPGQAASADDEATRMVTGGIQ